MMRKMRHISRQTVTRRQPQRTCIACRRVAGKRELVRLVRTDSGNIEVDTSGRMAGRGAYLCRRRECWEAGLRGGRLEHALRATMGEYNRQQLISHGEQLAADDNSGMIDRMEG